MTLRATCLLYMHASLRCAAGFDYARFHYCTMAGWAWVSGALLLAWVAVLIYLLCDTADTYFSPTLAAICDRLDLSPEVAGVTFLAFGNGAPDVFSSIAAVTGPNGAEHLLVGVGALLGAAIFISTVVVGSVVLTQPRGAAIRVPVLGFMRDALFLAAALLLVGWCGLRGEVSAAAAAGYLALYGAYVYAVFWVDRCAADAGP
jgi:solute carrier family 24 (sodium/potassium/calcium exchanger), member 6